MCSINLVMLSYCRADTGVEQIVPGKYCTWLCPHKSSIASVRALL